ncbi:ABC transporter permease [Kineosporia mesophila]|uniref:ABC transporter permease n=1 Tax=Kineosporia mesophila TaxID=566012 RepID=A0ABP6Z4G6_9ACTN|nr:ABC transporter permease [Kineosporia mesophila]MCD5352545.1 ABC transporter permease [Kineosporia mesophila]
MNTLADRAARWSQRTLVTLIYVFLWLPILVVAVVSIDTSTFLRFPPQGFSLDPYRTVFSTPEFMTGLVSSLIIAAFTTVITLAVAICASLAFTRQSFRGSGAAQAFLTSPLLVPNIVLGLALLLLFSPLALNDTYTGLVLAHVVLCLPYAIRTISVSLSTVDVSGEDAARVLGASPWVTFRRVTLPLIRPGVIAGAVLSFLVSFDEAVVSLFLAGYNITPLPVTLLDHLETQAGPEVAALSVLLILFSLLAVLAVERALGLGRSLRTRS